MYFNAKNKTFCCYLTQTKWLFEKGKMRQQNSSSAAWAGSIQLFTNSSQKGLLICTSNLQVHGCHLQVNLQVKFAS